MSTEIEWKSDWKLTEESPVFVHLRDKADGELTIGQLCGDHVEIIGSEVYLWDDKAASYYDLGPPCRIGDAAEVQRLNVELEMVRGLYREAGSYHDSAEKEVQRLRSVFRALQDYARWRVT